MRLTQQNKALLALLCAVICFAISIGVLILQANSSFSKSFEKAETYLDKNCSSLRFKQYEYEAKGQYLAAATLIDKQYSIGCGLIFYQEESRQ